MTTTWSHNPYVGKCNGDQFIIARDTGSKENVVGDVKWREGDIVVTSDDRLAVITEMGVACCVPPLKTTTIARIATEAEATTFKRSKTACKKVSNAIRSVGGIKLHGMSTDIVGVARVAVFVTGTFAPTVDTQGRIEKHKAIADECSKAGIKAVLWFGSE